MSRFLLGLRLARRDLRRAPLRTVLVFGLVMLPTAGMAAVVIMLATSQWSPTEYREAHAGQADLTAVWNGSWDATGTIEDLEALLPDGADLIVENQTYDFVSGGDESSNFRVSDLDIAAGSSEGRFRSVEGTPPEGGDQAAISAAMARHQELEVGDTFLLEALGREVTVTAVVDAWEADGTFGRGGVHVYLGSSLVEGEGAVPGAADQALSGALGDVGITGFGTSVDSRVLVDLPAGMLPDARRHDMVDSQGTAFDLEEWGWYAVEGGYRPALLPALAPAAEAGWGLRPVTEIQDSDGPILNFTYLFGAVGLVILGTIVTAAFAVGARRQLRSLGLMTCAGAPPSVLRWYLIAQGVIGGLVGSVLGIVVAGIGVSLVPERTMRAFIGHAVPGVDLPIDGLVPVVVIGTVVAAGAAAIPAWTAARVPTLAALAGRRPQGRVPAFVPVLGMIAVGLGCVLLFGTVGVAADPSGDRGTLAVLMAVAGSLLVIMGSTAMAPTLVGALEGAVKRAPSSWRLAGRSLARSRVRSSAVVAAVVAATIVLVAASTLLVSLTRPADPLASSKPLPQDLVVLTGVDDVQVDEVRALLGDAESVELPTFDVTVLALVRDPEVVIGDGVHSIHTSSTSLGQPVLATEEVRDLYEVPDGLRRVLDEGGWVLTDGVDGYEVELEVTSPWFAQPVLPPEASSPLGPDGGSVVVPAPVREPGMEGDPFTPTTVEVGGSYDASLGSWSTPRVLVGSEGLEALGPAVPTPTSTVALQLPDPISPSQAAALETLRTTWGDEARGGWIDFPAERDGRLTSTQVRALVLAGVFLAVLGVVAVGLLLAGRDSRDEAAVLSAVGAPPSAIRRVGAARAVLLVAVAVALALPAGLLAAWSLFTAVRSETSDWFWYPRFEIDPTILAFVLLMAPLIGVVTWAGGLLRDAVRPARPVEMGAWE